MPIDSKIPDNQKGAWWSWRAMRNRCEQPSDVSYRYYGGRGIKVSEPWRKFANFFADMGERPDGMTLDRKDNDGHYDQANCRWATDLEQARNRPSATRSKARICST